MLYKEQIIPILNRLRNQTKILELGGNPFPIISHGVSRVPSTNTITPDMEKIFAQELDREIRQLENLLQTAKSVYDR